MSRNNHIWQWLNLMAILTCGKPDTNEDTMGHFRLIQKHEAHKLKRNAIRAAKEE